jgi:secreted trypsin-like serine protease
MIKLKKNCGMVVLVLVALAAGFAGCGGEEILVDYSSARHFIYNGSPPNAPEHDAVVALLQVQGNYAYFFCSGTLIRPDVVLTAAHCLKGKKANRVLAAVGNSLSAGQYTLYYSSSLTVHPQYNSRTMDNDIALLKLKNNVAGVTPVPEAPATIGLVQGEKLNFAGFGEQEDGTYGVKLQVDGTLDGFGCSATDCNCQVPPGIPAHQICYKQSPPATGSGPCFGDSGGPAFVYRNGKAYVAGMTSYGDQYCTIYGVSTRADAFESFIHGFAGAD